MISQERIRVLVERLAEQQAMPDDWWKSELESILAASAPANCCLGCTDECKVYGSQHPIAASAPALQAQRFSCYLERDFGKAPCDQDCGKLRCMYPSALQAGQGERYCETCERNVTEPCNSADCSTPEVAQWCVCGSPSAPNVTHRKDGPCFHEDTHQDFNPGRPDYKALYEGTLQQLKDVMRIVDGPRPSDPKSDGWKISVVGAAMATAAGKNLPNENAWLLAAYNAVVADVAASAPALQAQGEPWREGVSLLVEAWDRYWPTRDAKAAEAFVLVIAKSRAMLAASPTHERAAPAPEPRIDVHHDSMGEVRTKTYKLAANSPPDVVMEALRRLVDLEDMRLRLIRLHEMGHGTDWDHYLKGMPLAWEAARKVIAQTQESGQ